MASIGYIASVLMGVSLGLVGGGGSILTVPILVYFFAVDPLVATSDSLFVVGATALLGGILSLRQGEVEVKTAVLFATPSFLGVLLTKAVIVPNIPDPLFSVNNFILSKPLLIMGIFALLMLLASFTMIRGKKISVQNIENSNQSSWASLVTQGFFVGCVTGLVGAGGGFLIVPALIGIVGLSVRSAIGTSLIIIAANSLFGFAVALSRGLDADWKLLLTILILALIGLMIGAHFSKKISEKFLKKGFGYFVLIMGSAVLLDQLLKL